RPEAIDKLGVAGRVEAVRSTDRMRLALPPVSAASPIGGFLYLEWADTPTASRISPAENLGRLIRHRRVAALGIELEQLLTLAGLPALAIGRKRSWERPEDTADWLLGAVRDSDRCRT
ncbi:MAG: hypothetical protein ACLP8S_28875, partial [Solirubrobacteraceae bacterium]